MKFDIIEYLGKIEDGALVILSLNYEDEYYEATFYYKNQFVTLTVDEKLEEVLECSIEKWKGYNKLVLEIVERLVPYNEIINTLDEIDLDYYFGEAEE
jgi:isopenicillin N synthase-like dioxygenase